MAANAKPALEKIRRIQKPKNERYSELYPKILQNSFPEQRAHWPEMHFQVNFFSAKVAGASTQQYPFLGFNSV